MILFAKYAGYEKEGMKIELTFWFIRTIQPLKYVRVAPLRYLSVEHAVNAAITIADGKIVDYATDTNGTHIYVLEGIPDHGDFLKAWKSL